jgi:hypothetical protein
MLRIVFLQQYINSPILLLFIIIIIIILFLKQKYFNRLQFCRTASFLSSAAIYGLRLNQNDAVPDPQFC